MPSADLTIPPLPRLAGDEAYRAQRPGWRLSERQYAERVVVWATIHAACEEFPQFAVAVDDGDDLLLCQTPEEALEHVFGLDDCKLYWGRHWVRVILGNGWDAVADYGSCPEMERAIRRACVAVGIEL